MSIDVFSTLHDEILTEIFSRVPAKTVGKSRCLSKAWKTRLSTSHFINLHLSRNTHQKSLILLSHTKSIDTIKLPFENPTNSIQLQLGNGNSWTELMGSCNGLVLLLNQEKDMFLVNPTTLEQFKVPSIEFGDCGFGYDSFSNDYKIVTITKHYSTRIIQVDLYSVKLGVWKRINHSLNCFDGNWSHNGVFVNGCVNWIVKNSKSGVLCTLLGFDVATEVFREIDLPSSINKLLGQSGGCRAFDHGGYFCTIWTLISGNKMTKDIWMMKEYGDGNSWTKLASLDGNGNGKWWMGFPLWIGENEIVFIALKEFPEEELADDKAMVVYDLRQGTVKEMVVNGVVASFRDGWSFVDSLVSLRGFISAN